MRKRPCLLFACIFLTGLAFQRYQWNMLVFVPVVFIGLEIYHAFWGETGIEKQKIKRMAGRSVLLLSAFFLSMSHMKTEEEFRNAYMSKIEDDGSAVIWGEIIKIEKTDYGSRLLLSDCYVNLQEANVPCNKIMVYASSDHFQVGQIYQIKGKFHLLERARNFGNFDSAIFYQSQKIDFSVYEEESTLLASDENSIRDGLLELKQRMEKVYKSSLEEGAAGFYMGMMLGDKSLLQDRTKDLFALGGISHILAISGLHMSIIGRGFYKLLRKHRIGFLSAGILAGLLLAAYCFMVGNGVSAIRAVGMMLISFLAQWFGRSYDMLNALGAVVIYLLWENPFLLEYSGFQFSIAALIGVGFVGQVLSGAVKSQQRIVEKESRKKYFKEIARRMHLGESVWMSIGITLATLPIVAYCYFEVPMYSTLVNSIVLPILTPIFVLALLGALIGCVLPIVANVLLMPCGWLFSFYEWVCELVEQLPFANVITGKPEREIIVLYYVVLFCGCLLIGHKTKKQKMQVHTKKEVKELGYMKKYYIQVMLTVLCFFIILCTKTPKSEIVFLDVGQGDGIYIGSEDGTTCFIDGGSSDVKQVGTYRILPFLKAHGVKNIDYWFVSHADTDHISGLLEVMEEGYEIGHLVISDKMPKDENQQKLLSKAQEDGIEVVSMKAGEQICSDHIEISCLYPWEIAEDRNEQSMALWVEFLDDENHSIFSGLFTGDIASEGEQQLLEKSVLDDVDLFKAAHHGSKYSNSMEFLEVIRPEFCVISCGVENSYGHPHEETLERLQKMECEFWITAEHGEIVMEIDKINEISDRTPSLLIQYPYENNRH